jgi:putative tricarboxylic transport membrane protein
MKKHDIIPIIFWIALSFFVMIFSYKYSLGKFDDPGPGLMPFLLAILLLITSFWLILKSTLKREGITKSIEKEGGKGQINFRRIIPIIASLFAYSLFLEILGYLITTFIFSIILYRITGFKRWRSLLLVTALTTLVSYFLFTSLGLRFPDGIFRGILKGR